MDGKSMRGHDLREKAQGNPEEHSSLIRWRDWSQDAFEEARHLNRPILLDIFGTWCYWCHRMDWDTYSDKEVASLINQHFIPIRVDTDKRPDVNKRYNMGGWPTTAFLTPEGRVITGGTYIPPNHMKAILKEIIDHWNRNKDRPPPSTIEPREEYGLKVPPRKGEITNTIIEDIIGEIANDFDPIYGGFGSQPKFPHSEAIEFALSRYHYTKNREFLRIVTRTLEAMAKGGIYDREMGGFFRYSATRDWSIPHYEKMSEDNAKLLLNYLHAYQVTGNAEFLRIAQEIVEYVNSTLSDQERGGFYGSQDADEEYYKLTREERLKVKEPYVDKTLYTNWNSMMASAYLLASVVLDRPELKGFALKTIHRLLEVSYIAGEGMYHYYDGAPHLPSQLTDQAYMARCLTDAYEHTGNAKYLRLAEEIMSCALRYLYDGYAGGFYDTPPNPKAPGYLRRPLKPLDENSVAAQVLLRLYYLKGGDAYLERAEETLRTFADAYLPYGMMAAEYAMAVDLYINGPTQITIVGPEEHGRTKELMMEGFKLYEPRKVMLILDPKEDSERLTQLGYPAPRDPAAYVCVGKVCTAPITNPKSIAVEIARLIGSQASIRA